MKRILFLLVAVGLFFNANASHFIGGEITWTCDTDPLSPDYGKYTFFMTIYQDCDGIDFNFGNNAEIITVHNNPALTAISMNFLDTNDISSSGVSGSGTCYDCDNQPFGQFGAVREWIYTSGPIVVPGAPPVNGWHFTWGTCCRSSLLTQGMADADWTIRSVMYSYTDANGVVFPNGNMCYDNSPTFKEKPKSILCTGYPFSYSHLAFDVELDSLSYAWAEPLGNDLFYDPNNPAAIALPFSPPYSAISPIPGNPTLDNENGEISFNSNISGVFVTCVKVSAFKCGQIVAEVFRDVNVALLSCGLLPNGAPNLPPVITAPAGSQTWVTTNNPSTGLPSYETSIDAGDLVNFSVFAVDTDFNSTGNQQNLSLEVEGGQLDPNLALGSGATFTITSSSPGSISGDFLWQTTCDHVAADIGCGASTSIYVFNVKAYDDFCPANGIVIATITIEIMAGFLPAPSVECVWRSDDGLIFPLDNPPPLASGAIYHIYGSNNIGGPYTILDDVVYLGNQQVILDELLIPVGIEYFYLTSESLCADSSSTSDTLSPVDFQISTTDVSCWDDVDGTISIYVEDYIDVLSYEFYLDGDLNLNSHPLDTFFDGVSAGLHYVIVIDTTSSCTLPVPVTINAPGFPLQVILSDSMNICSGGSDGIAIGEAIGGSPGYVYSWYESGNPQSFSDNDTAFNLSAGSYYLEVTDTNGCDTIASINVLEPQVPLHGVVQVFGVQCKGESTGMLVVDGGGGFGPYDYEWFDMFGTSLQFSAIQIDRDTLKNLSAGSYVLHVSDSKDCLVEYVLNVPEPDFALSIDSMKVVNDIACFGGADGRAIAYVSGGQLSYSFEWDNGEDTLVAQELTSGYHVFSLIDAWGCEVLDSIEVSENDLIVSDLVVDTTVSCYGFSDGGVSVVTLSGGSSSVYTYFWSTGQQDDWVSTAFVDSLPYGSYYVTTRDSLGCEVVDSIFISEPEPLSMEAMELDWVDCYNDATGEGAAIASEGTSPYVFSWDTDQWIGDTITTLTKGLHIVVVTDARGCTASDTVEIHNPDSLYINIIDSLTVLPYCMGVNTASLSAVAFGGTGSYIYEWDDNLILPQTTTIAANLLAGVYTVTVTDDKGCTAFDTRDIDTITNTMDADTVLISQYASNDTDSIGAVLDSNEVSCFGLNDGEVAVNAWGGHAPYEYQWYGPNSFSSVSSVITNLYAGTYSVTVRDINDCMVNTSVVLAEPLALTFNTSAVVDESCLGACDGEIFVDSIAGGAATYSALLTNNVTGVTTPHTIADDTIKGVCSGNYTVVLTDVNDCPSSVIFGGLNQQQVSTLVFTEADIQAIMDTVCYAELTGELTVNNPNTNTGYTYNWENVNDPGLVIDTGTTVSNLGAGTYMLLAGYNNTDGCIDTAIITITSLAMLNVTNYVVTDADCYGASTGEVVVTADPLGVTPYTYSWSTGDTTATATTLSAGPHILTLTDGNGCDQDFSYMVNEPDSGIVNITNQNYILTANSSGGTPPYTYLWKELSTTNPLGGAQPTYTVSSIGSYYVIVTDANGCEYTSNIISFGTTALISTDVIALNIYPNPFKDETTVDFGRVIKQATITVVDVYGKLIETYNITNQQTQIIKRNNKASGVYFLEIEMEKGKTIINKLIID